MINNSQLTKFSREKGSKKNHEKTPEICCAFSAVFLIIILGTLLILFFTVFKPKEPIIIPLPATLTYLELELPPPEITLNVSLAMFITVDNRNYGAFKYENSTAYINYHDELIAAATISEGRIGARSKQNIIVTVDVLLATDKVLSNPINIWSDYNVGVFNLTSSTTMHGKVSPLNLNMIKVKATSDCTCDIFIFIDKLQHQIRAIESVCKSKIKL